MNFDDKDLFDPRNPSYTKDSPKEPEVFKCGLCDEKFEDKLEKWNTKSGVMSVCGFCIKEGVNDNYTILIEPLNG
jgi:hypothetical protein